MQETVSVGHMPTKRKEVSVLGKRVKIFRFAQQRMEHGIETLS